MDQLPVTGMDQLVFTGTDKPVVAGSDGLVATGVYEFVATGVDELVVTGTPSPLMDAGQCLASVVLLHPTQLALKFDLASESNDGLAVGFALKQTCNALYTDRAFNEHLQALYKAIALGGWEGPDLDGNDSGV